MATESFITLFQRIEKRVSSLCTQFDAVTRKRRRKIDSKIIVGVVLKLVAASEGRGYGAVLADVSEELAWPRLAASSFCVARRKLTDWIFRLIHRRCLEQYDAGQPPVWRWRGRRLFVVDGSKITLPRALAARGYRVPPNGYYPMALLSCLYRLGDRQPIDFLLDRHEDERALAHRHLTKLGQGDVVIYDRGYLSYDLLSAHVEQGSDAIFRLAERGTFAAVEAFWRSSAREKIVTVRPTENTKQATLPSVRLRLVKYRLAGKTYGLATTLLARRRFPRKDFASLYHARWGIEELYKTSKRVLRIEQFHARDESGVRQEIAAHFILVSLARMLANAAQTHVCVCRCPRSLERRMWPKVTVNFKYAIQSLTRHLDLILIASSLSRRRKTLDGVLENIARLHQRRREGRHEPRRSRQPYRRWMPLHHASQSA